MSVIIRLQNLPWSANALDIRQFFKGLSIPEGGVHIVGGEMGDAFIAFSTDEDARQAMMHDREKINEVQVRLLLSSRAEMQKVIETARQQSMLALQNAQKTTGLATTTVTAPYTTPQPPIITTNSLQTILSSSIGAAPSFLAYQQQAGITITEKKSEMAENGKSSVAPRSGGDTFRERPRSKSGSRERRRSRSRERSSRRRRSRDRSRSRDKKVRYPSRRSRSKDRDRETIRSRDHIRNSVRTSPHNKEKQPTASNTHNASNSGTSMDSDGNDNAKAYLSAISSWNTPPLNAYKTNYSIGLSSSSHKLSTSTSSFLGLHNPTSNSLNSYTTASNNPVVDSIKFSTSSTIAPIIIPAFQSYTSAMASTANNYSINLLGNSNSNSNDSSKAFALKNPYTTAIQAANVANVTSNSQDMTSSLLKVQKQATTMFPGLLLEGKSETSSSKTSNPMQGDQEPIAFASTNPYAQIYPGLFAQAAALSSTAKPNPQNPSLPKETPMFEKFPDSCCIKIANMCGNTTYSDLRKFFSGLFIPHNGIKMVNDRHGLRAGIAYIQFSRVSNVQKALSRNNALLKGKAIQIEVVSENEFEAVEDSFRPQSRFDKVDRSTYSGKNDSENWTEKNDGVDTISQEKVLIKDQEKLEPFNVLYIEDIPALTTEQDIMKMFSSYTIYDILLTSSPENRREFIAHVKFSRESEAKCALEDKSRHLIGYRKVRVRPGREANMEKAKEKLRLANEQLLKEEQSIIDADLKQSEVIKNAHPNGSGQNNHDAVNKNIGGSRTDIEGPINPFNQNCFIPSIFDLNAPRPESLENGKANDPRLIGHKSKDGSILKIQTAVDYNTYNSFASSFMYQADTTENNFILLKNCEYNLRINDLAQLFLSSNLKLKHIELLRNDRQIPSGEFIVEFQNSHDAEKAINNFNNTRFRSRNIKIHHISPQEIADRLQKPFLNYLPNANGRPSQPLPETFDYQIKPNETDMRSKENVGYRTGSSVPSTRGMRSFAGNNVSSGRVRNVQQKGRSYDNMNDNRDETDISDSEKTNQDYDISNADNENRSENVVSKTFNSGSRSNDHSSNTEGEDGIPEKFTRPGCVLTMENVPFKADLKDILSFFHEFHLLPDDIIRRFNDDGSPTGDARVAFETPAMARAAFEAKRRKHIFNRTIYISIL